MPGKQAGCTALVASRAGRHDWGCQGRTRGAILGRGVNLHLHDTVGYQGIGFEVEGILDYDLGGRVLRLARLRGAGEVRYLEVPASDISGRVLLFSEIQLLDITTTPPATIDHGGESFLLKLSGAATVVATGSTPGRESGACSLWRYRAAGDRFLQIESWPDRVRMLEGATVHRSMLEMRPATRED
jgi:hypothetical protein